MENLNLFESITSERESREGQLIKLLGKLPPLHLEAVSEIANSPSRDVGYTRTYYSYPAKFQAQLPEYLISEATRPGDLVCDPYCGGGTTGLESMLLGRPSIGYDLNQFAILISKVKTTKIDVAKIEKLLPVLTDSHNEPSESVFDDGDIECIGPHIAKEINSINFNIEASKLTRSSKNLLKLALIHTVKIVGRRDFNMRNHQTLNMFDDMPSRSTMPLFMNKVRAMLAQNATLPSSEYKPRFYCASNHRMKVEDRSVDLIVTSPPYKDLDVEYGLIQLQRPELNRSKRSEVIWRALGTKSVDKTKLCGNRGDSYWGNFSRSIIECKRVLKRRHLAFFWIGFKNQKDQDVFCSVLDQNRLRVEHMVPVRLGDDRVASSRSTHHGRETGMMKRDYLIVTRSV